MPRRDGTGPAGAGQGKGRGQETGGGAGWQLGGNCVCPKGGQKGQHTRGVPGNTRKCPKCGSLMTRA